MKKIFFMAFLFFAVNSLAQIQSSDTILIPNDTLKNFNKSLFGDSLASSFYIVIHKEVKLHKHQFHSEHVYVISGEGEMILGNEKRKIKSGDIIFIPKETPHALKVTSTEPVKILSVQSPYFDGKDRIMLE